jgi:protein SCO1/2
MSSRKQEGFLLFMVRSFSSIYKRIAKSCLLLPAVCLLFTPASGQLGKDMQGPLYGQRPEFGRPEEGLPKVLQKVGVDQKLGAQVPLDAVFRDENGAEVKLGQYFSRGKPVVLSLVYYECPMLCSQVLNGLLGSMKALTFTAGKEFDVVTVSFDAREKSEVARKKKETYLKSYGRAGAENGWRFLTGEQASIDALTNAVGFRYAWDESSKQFAHASVIILITPEGKVARYFFGVEYAPKEMRLGLVEASENKVGTLADALLLYCFHYDPTTGKYGLVVMNIIRLGGILTIVGIIGLLLLMRRQNRKRQSGIESLKAGGAA